MMNGQKSGRHAPPAIGGGDGCSAKDSQLPAPSRSMHRLHGLMVIVCETENMIRVIELVSRTVVTRKTRSPA